MGVDLTGKRALVTGGGKRVGAAICRALGAAGAHVAVHYRSSSAGADRVRDELTSLGAEAFTLAGDLSDRGAARRVVSDAIAGLGGLDLLVLSAANFDRVPFDAIDDDAWDRALALNLTAPFVMAHAARNALRESGGSIVQITCVSRRAPYRDFLPYQVSKAGVHQLMRLLALELAPDVRVNAVAPGSVLPPEEWDQAQLDELCDRIPLARIGTAEDISRAVIYLATQDFTTGEELLVDGGRALT